jgi:hypothetical protein
MAGPQLLRDWRPDLALIIDGDVPSANRLRIASRAYLKRHPFVADRFPTGISSGTSIARTIPSNALNPLAAMGGRRYIG